MADVSDLNPAFTPLLNAYTAALDKAGIGYRVDSGYRSPEQQAEIYARSNQGRNFAAAPPWRSFHNYGLAADVIPTNPADYGRMHDLARQAGLYDAQQGQGFTGYDPPHVEMPGSLTDVVNKYQLANWRPVSHPAPAQGALAYAGPMGTTLNSQPYEFKLPANAPMGMGNNNPLNIKYVEGAPWAGVVGPSKNTDQGDPQIVFSSPEAGWSAGYQLLSKKYGSGMTTPAAIIAGKGGWTPGNMQAAENIAKSAGIGVNDDIGFSDPTKAAKFMRALVTQEQGGAGSAYPDAMILNAISGKATPSTPGTTINTTTPGGGVGGALAGLAAPTGADQKGPSELEQMQKTFGGGQGAVGGGQPMPQQNLQGEMAAGMGPGAMRQQQIAMQAQQMMAALQQRAAQPLTWGPAPFGSAAGQQIPGTTLNSMGG